jgi:23S rRNA (cytosine1962-C5)-methyltransferase
MTEPTAIPAAALPVVKLKIERRSSHPWVFRNMVERPDARIAPGSVVDVVDVNGQWVARAFYNGHSRITLRVLTSKADEAVDAAPTGSCIPKPTASAGWSWTGSATRS